MSRGRLHLARALPLLASLVALGVQGAPSCQNAQLFRPGLTVELQQSGKGGGIRLESELLRDLQLPLANIDAGTLPRQPGKLADAVHVRDAVLGGPAAGALAASGKGNGTLVAVKDDVHYQIRVHDGKPESLDGDALQLVPLTASKVAFTIPKDSTVTAISDTTMTIGAGSRLEWAMDGTEPLRAAFAAPARLEQTAGAAGGGGQLIVERPVSVLAGGKMQVRLTAPGVNLQSQSPIFCLYLPKADQPVQAEQVRIVKLEGASGVYEVRVPATWEYHHGEGRAVADLETDGEIFWLNRRAALRALVLDGDHVVVDVQRRFPLSRALVAAAVGVTLLLLLFLISGVFLNHTAPLANAALPARVKKRVRRSFGRAFAYAGSLLGRLIQQPDGRYSLSNLQIMLWTVLVIFALTYVWVSTGEVLVLSNGILVLLGISGGTSVLARFLQPGPTTAQPSSAVPSVKDLVTTDGTFDLLRFQMLGFTMFAWVYSLASVLLAEGLPEIPPSLYGLLGISNGTYLGGKLQQKWATEDATAAPAVQAPSPLIAQYEGTLVPTRVSALQAKVGAPLTGRIDQATRNAVMIYKAQNGIVPADGSIDNLLTKKLGV